MTWTIEHALAPDGARLRVGRAGSPRSRATCLLLQGRGDFLEKHAEVASRLTDLGLSVVSLDWRGQGGSERTGVRAGVADLASFDRLLEDARWLAATRDTPPLVVMGHSMGGLVTASWLTRHRDEVDAAILLSPMLGFRSVPTWLAHAAAAAAVALGAGSRLAPGERPADPDRDVLTDDMATNDPAAHARLVALRRRHPELVVEGATWRWVRAAARAMRDVDATDLTAVRTEVLVASVTADPSVDAAAHHRFMSRLPRGTLRTYAGRHDLLAASASTTERLWRHLEEHLRPWLPIRPPTVTG
jgi:lysophospholipase